VQDANLAATGLLLGRRELGSVAPRGRFPAAGTPRSAPTAGQAGGEWAPMPDEAPVMTACARPVAAMKISPFSRAPNPDPDAPGIHRACVTGSDVMAGAGNSGPGAGNSAAATG
jgi:hypothetical protein